MDSYALMTTRDEGETGMSAQGNVRLAILGGTGPTGRQLLAQAKGRGLEVTTLAREPAKLGDLRGALTVVQGTITDLETVERVVTGCSAVLSALGHVKDSPEDLLTTASLNMVAAMKKLGVKRLIVLTDTGVEDSSDRPPLAQKMLREVLRLGNRKLTLDSIPAAKVIADSGLDWTLVGPRY